jgi:hypothetical protein
VEISRFAEAVRKRGSELCIFAPTVGANIDNKRESMLGS